MDLKRLARKHVMNITLLTALLLVLAVPAIAFSVHTETTGSVTLTPGVVISLVSGHGNITFSANRTFSSLSVSGTMLTIDGVGFGVNKSAYPAVTVTITKWTAFAPITGGSIIEFTASSTAGVSFVLNAAGDYVLTRGGTGQLIGSSDVGTLHISSMQTWSGTQTFAWVRQAGSIGNVITYGPWVFGFILIMALILTGTWWVKSKGRGGR